MSSGRIDCAIAGADPAGLLLALLLARRGWRVAVVRSDRERDRRSAGINPFLSPPVLELLERLGLSAALVKVGHPVRRVVEYPARGRPYTLDYGSPASGPFGYALSVPLLMLTKVLHEALARETSVHIVDGGPVVGVAGSATGGVDLELARGGAVGCRWAVGSDGMFSRVRRRAGIEAEILAFDRPLVMIVIPLPAGWPEHISAHHVGRDALVTTIPLAEGRLIVQWLADPRELEEVRAAGLARLRSRLTGVLPELRAPLAASATGWDRIRIIQHRIVRPARWSRGSVGLLGDAAHGLHSFGGQGLSMALQDTVVLACSLARTETDAKHAPFACYEKLRRPFVESFQRYQMSLPQLNSQPFPGNGEGLLYEDIAEVMKTGQIETTACCRYLLEGRGLHHPHQPAMVDDDRIK